MPNGNPLQFRYVNYIATRVLTAEELKTQQQLDRLVSSSNTPVAYALNATYKPGALRNVSVQVVGTTATLSPVDNTLPMLVFVRGIWEPFTSGPINLGSSTVVYLNYVVVSQPQDGNDAEMAELQINLALADTSGAPNGAATPTELERNPSPIPVMTFTNANGTAAYLPQDMTYAVSRGSKEQAGIVKLSTDTSGGAAVSTDDPVTSNQRVPVDSSVTTAKVVPVISNGLNTDGTPHVDPAAQGQGGIKADHLIYAQGTQTVEDAIRTIDASMSNFLSALNAHIGAKLGPGVHPMPSSSDVGAAPIGHVGATFDNGQHTPLYTNNRSGFIVQRDGQASPNAGDFAFLLRKLTGEPVIGISHTGDISIPTLPYGTLSAALNYLQGLLGQAQGYADSITGQMHSIIDGEITSAVQGLARIVGYGTVTLGSRTLGHSAQVVLSFDMGFAKPDFAVLATNLHGDLGQDFNYFAWAEGSTLYVRLLNSSYTFTLTSNTVDLDFKIITI